MKTIKKAIEKVEFELPIFLILAVKLPFAQLKTYWFSFVILCFTIAWFLGKSIRRTEKNAKIFCLFFIALLLSGDIMKSVFMPSVTFAYVIYAKTASFLCFLFVILFIRNPVPFFQKPVFSAVIPFLCVIGIILGPSFAFFFIPIVLILIIFENYKRGKMALNSVFWTVLLCSMLISAVFITTGHFSDNKLMGFIPFGIAFKILNWTEILKATAAILPLIFFFAVLWTDTYKSTADKMTKKIIALCMTEPILVIIINIFFYYTASDGWKYFIFMAVFTQFCLLFYFLDSGEKAVVASAEKIGLFLKKNLFILLTVMIYLIKITDIFYNR